MIRRRHLYAVVSLLLYLLAAGAFSLPAAAQSSPWKEFRIQGDVMSIKLSKQISRSALDSFIQYYRLFDLGLNSLVFQQKPDSLLKAGWMPTVTADAPFYLFTKKLLESADLKKPVDPIVYSRVPTPENWRKIGGNRVVYGINRFARRPFPVYGDTVLFILSGFTNARDVRLAGNFTNWQHSAFRMKQSEGGWMAAVKLEPGQYFYKFIIDGKWITDPENFLKESDGLGNINSVFFVPNKTVKLAGYKDAKEVFVTGSFNNWVPNDLALEKQEGGWRLDLYLQPGTYHYHFVVDRTIVEPDDVGSGKNSLTIALGKPTTFFLPGFAGASNVFLAGDFNEWRRDEIPLKKVDGGWEASYVLGPGNYQYKFIADGKWQLDPANPSVVDDGKGNLNSYLVVAPNYTFRLKNFSHARRVMLAGDFNNWSQTALPMKRVNNEWVCSIYLGRGKHAYKFVVDGRWLRDPANSLWEEDDGNSILWIE